MVAGSPDPARPARLPSLDQFRGYTVVGMLLVNFLGGFAAVPAVLKHHNTYCSYADTIMPQFFFAVGFAYRLTFLRRVATLGRRAAALPSVRRNLGLILLGLVLYHLDGRMTSWEQMRALGWRGFLTSAFVREPFQTLTHIALASLWALPVIGAGVGARLAYLAFSATLHLGLSAWFYFAWVWAKPGIDGGPLGFLTWSVPLLVGSLAFDAVREAGGSLATVARLLGWSVALAGAGYALSCLGYPGELAPPPFVAPAGPVSLWSMSQRAGTLSYQLFASGFALAAYALCVALCDRAGWESGLFRTFGRNALIAYVLHGLVAGAVKPYVPDDAPGWYVALGFLVALAINTLFMRDLERKGLFFRL